MRRYFPEARLVTTARAANHRLQFHAAGHAHRPRLVPLQQLGRAWGNRRHGVVFEHPERHFEEDYDDFERCAVTAHGDDGNAYDCWTYRMTNPGIPMRPPNFYWQHIPAGMAQWKFPQAYVDSVLATYEAAAPCPRADRPNPSAIPGKSADSR